MQRPPVLQTPNWGLLLVMTTWFLGWLPPGQAVASCTLPSYLYHGTIHFWASKIQDEGKVVGRQHAFDARSMNVSEDAKEHSLTCHKAVGANTFIMRQTKDNVPVYTCVRFDQWSSNVIQLRASSPPELRSSRALCAEDRLVADPWLLVWRQLDQGYVPCPEIGGYDMEVLNSEGTSFCEYINPVPTPRLESECVRGEGMLLEFRLGLCKGDRISLERTQRLYCLGHKEIGGYTHVVVTDTPAWPKSPKTLMLRYSETNSSLTIDMHLLDDIAIETSDVISKLTGHIRLTKTMYNNLCQDYFDNCNAPESCDEYNLKNCQATCRNYTTCLQDSGSCDFDLITRGTWVEKSSTGTRVFTIGNQSALLSELGSFKCLNAYSSTPTGPKPIVKIMSNGCKPRFACLDAEAYSKSVLKYRISKSEQWPFKANLVRGDLCRETSFADGSSPFETQFQNKFPKVFVRAPVGGTASRRVTVSCNLPSTISFSVASSGRPCSGTLRMCQSGHSMVMTFGSECALEAPRLFYRCLAEYKTPSQQYIITERSDEPGELHCWLRREDPGSSEPNVLVQMYAADCTNGTQLSLSGDGIGVPYLLRLQYNAQEQDSSADSCLDIRSPATTPPTTTKATAAPVLPTPSTTTPSSTTAHPTTPSSISHKNTTSSSTPPNSTTGSSTFLASSTSPSQLDMNTTISKLPELTPPSPSQTLVETSPSIPSATDAQRGVDFINATLTTRSMLESTENVSLSSATKKPHSPSSTLTPSTHDPSVSASTVKPPVITSSLRTSESGPTKATASDTPSTDIHTEIHSGNSTDNDTLTINKLLSEPQEQLTTAQSSTDSTETKPPDKRNSGENSLNVKSAPVYSRSSRASATSMHLQWVLFLVLLAALVVSR